MRRVGTLGAPTTPAGRSIYALGDALSLKNWSKDTFQANSDYNQNVAACHQAYGYLVVKSKIGRLRRAVNLFSGSVYHWAVVPLLSGRLGASSER